jgi:hypothetical protein
VGANVIEHLIAGAQLLHDMPCGAQVRADDGSLLPVVFHEQNRQWRCRRWCFESPLRR